MSDLGSTERRLLRALHAADEPSDDDRARVRSRLLVKIAASSGIATAVATTAVATTAATAPGAVTAAGTASVAPGAAAATTFTSFLAGSWKVGAAIVAVVGAAGGAAWMATSSKTSERPVAQTAAPAGHQVSKPAAASERRAEIPESVTPDVDTPKSTKGRTRSAEPSHQGDLEGELSLLENAQQALKQGDSERALAALDQHAAEHPGGALATERAGIRAVALCESGKTAEGQREARRFLSRNPKSPLAVRVRAACLESKK